MRHYLLSHPCMRTHVAMPSCKLCTWHQYLEAQFMGNKLQGASVNSLRCGRSASLSLRHNSISILVRDECMEIRVGRVVPLVPVLREPRPDSLSLPLPPASPNLDFSSPAVLEGGSFTLLCATRSIEASIQLFRYTSAGRWRKPIKLSGPCREQST